LVVSRVAVKIRTYAKNIWSDGFLADSGGCRSRHISDTLAADEKAEHCRIAARGVRIEQGIGGVQTLWHNLGTIGFVVTDEETGDGAIQRVLEQWMDAGNNIPRQRDSRLHVLLVVGIVAFTGYVTFTSFSTR
jgi:hypothetical protein